MNFILATEGTTPANGSPMTMILMMGGMFVLMYFMMIRPQKKRQKEEEAMRNAVDVGDEITTIGGIVGRVVTVKEDSIIIETGSDRVKMKFKKWCISTVDTVKEQPATAQPEKKSFFGKKKKDDVEPKTSTNE